MQDALGTDCASNCNFLVQENKSFTENEHVAQLDNSKKNKCWCCGKIGGYGCFYCSPVKVPKGHGTRGFNSIEPQDGFEVDREKDHVKRTNTIR